MTKETRSAVVTAAIVSVAGGAFGTFVSFKLLQQQVDSISRELAAQGELIARNKIASDDRQDSLQKSIGEISGNVQYIRGRLEGPVNIQH